MLKFHIFCYILGLMIEALFANFILIFMKFICKVWKIWRSENEIFSFRNIFNSSFSSLTFGWFVIWIKNLMMRIQSRNWIETPVNIWLMLFIKWDNSFFSFNWKFFLNDQKQNVFFWRIETFKVGNFIHLWTILKLVFNSN